jgi:hypothetical protein
LHGGNILPVPPEPTRGTWNCHLSGHQAKSNIIAEIDVCVPTGKSMQMIDTLLPLYASVQFLAKIQYHQFIQIPDNT